MLFTYCSVLMTTLLGYYEPHFCFQSGLQPAQDHLASKLKIWNSNQVIGALYLLNSISRNHIQGTKYLQKNLKEVTLFVFSKPLHSLFGYFDC